MIGLPKNNDQVFDTKLCTKTSWFVSQSCAVNGVVTAVPVNSVWVIAWYPTTMNPVANETSVDKKVIVLGAGERHLCYVLLQF